MKKSFCKLQEPGHSKEVVVFNNLQQTIHTHLQAEKRVMQLSEHSSANIIFDYQRLWGPCWRGNQTNTWQEESLPQRAHMSCRQGDKRREGDTRHIWSHKENVLSHFNHQEAKTALNVEEHYLVLYL